MEKNEEVDWKKLEPGHEVKIFLTVLYSLILVLGIVGNSLTIHVAQVLQRNGYLQKNVTDHMVSLACSDLLVLLIGMPAELYSAIWFPFSSSSGDASCKIYNFLFEACSYATILNVATLSFERYMAICHPFRYKALSGGRTVKLLLSAWICSALVALPLLVATGTERHVTKGLQGPAQNLTFCTNLSQHWVMYRTSIFMAFILYLLVLGGVAFMCRAMIAVLRAPMGTDESSPNGAERRVPKHESARVKASRKQTILFLGRTSFALFSNPFVISHACLGLTLQDVTRFMIHGRRTSTSVSTWTINRTDHGHLRPSVTGRIQQHRDRFTPHQQQLHVGTKCVYFSCSLDDICFGSRTAPSDRDTNTSCPDEVKTDERSV